MRVLARWRHPVIVVECVQERDASGDCVIISDAQAETMFVLLSNMCQYFVRCKSEGKKTAYFGPLLCALRQTCRMQSQNKTMDSDDRIVDGRIPLAIVYCAVCKSVVFAEPFSQSHQCSHRGDNE